MNKKLTLFISLLVVFSISVGIIIGSLIKNGISRPVFQGIVKGNQNKITAILDLVERGYVDKVDVNNIIEKSIPEILTNLDPHTTYIPAKNMQIVEEEMRGNFSGVGIQFAIQDDTVRVIEVISGGPSSKVGLLPGDNIVSVNDSLIAGVNIDNNMVLKLLRGQKNSKVLVGINRKGYDEELKFEITRDDIPIYSVDVSYMIDNETGFVKISRFSDTTYDEFMEGMKKISNQGATKVIIDLRQNTGGLLIGVLRMLDEFLEKGETILYTEGLNQPRRTYNASGRNTWENMKVYVVIDEFSASASEIFAGAIQDNDRGIVIGRRSFGKGLVQEQIPLTDGSALRLTVARFYTPSGRCIQSPYENGNEEYYSQLKERLNSMEQLVADSIHFVDSLRYTTKSGRTVFGGGGIMPDVFVPVDTAGNSEYFNQIYRKGLIYSFAYSYADKYRSKLTDLGDVEEIETYLDGNNIMDEFIKYVSEKGIEKDDAGLKESGLIIQTQLKAYITRNIIGEIGFYPIIKQIDKTLLKAIEISKQDLLVENLNKTQTVQPESLR
ncbi:MAG: S41 family peptidase [Bacteroidales bacterium]|jgi:carboxyl-terminal processing protease|nr:S41 family peptidase [Bacteroidales bacterium]